MDTMRAIVLQKPGKMPRTMLREMPDPIPGFNEIVVKVEACGFCHHDALVMSGLLRRGVKRDVVLGHELCGTVIEVGEGVSDLWLGQRIVPLLVDSCGNCDRCLQGREHWCETALGIGHARDGGFAERIKLREDAVVRVPEGIEPYQAALLACPIGVTLQALREMSQIKAGMTVVVTGAGGGLGIHAVQIAKSLGAYVIGVTGSPKKIEGIMSYGAHDVVVIDGNNFSEEILALNNDKGVDLVVETVGSARFTPSLQSLGRGGRIIVLGEIAGNHVDLSLAELLFRSIQIYGSIGVDKKFIRDASQLVANRSIEPVVAQTLPLEEILEAYWMIQERTALGRVVLLP